MLRTDTVVTSNLGGFKTVFKFITRDHLLLIVNNFNSGALLKLKIRTSSLPKNFNALYNNMHDVRRNFKSTIKFLKYQQKIMFSEAGYHCDHSFTKRGQTSQSNIKCERASAYIYIYTYIHIYIHIYIAVRKIIYWYVLNLR